MQLLRFDAHVVTIAVGPWLTEFHLLLLLLISGVESGVESGEVESGWRPRYEDVVWSPFSLLDTLRSTLKSFLTIVCRLLTGSLNNPGLNFNEPPELNSIIGTFVYDDNVTCWFPVRPLFNYHVIRVDMHKPAFILFKHSNLLFLLQNRNN